MFEYFKIDGNTSKYKKYNKMFDYFKIDGNTSKYKKIQKNV